MIYELRLHDINGFATLIESDESNVSIDTLLIRGKALVWETPPIVEKYFDRKRKSQKERADFGAFLPGTVVLSRKAYDLLHNYLVQYGQLLHLPCKDGEAWLYNVTTIIPCVDYEKSEKLGEVVMHEVLHEENVPASPCIFKDLHTASFRIYLNQAAKHDLETIIAQAGLTGVEITPAAQSRY